MKGLAQRCAWICVFALCSVIPAFANQPPGPGVSLPQIVMLPMMALFTVLGGGYAMLRAEKKTRLGKAAKWIAIVVLFVFGFTHEGASMLVTCLFGAVAIYRGLRMIRWGLQSRVRLGDSSAVPEIAGQPWRPITAGALMSAVALFLTGSALVFVNYWPDIYQHGQIVNLKRVLASEIAYGRAQKQQTGETRFYRIKSGDGNDRYAEELLRHGNVSVDFSPDQKHFTVYILPYSKFPPWPYRLLAKQGSYRADESGQIRMVQVQRRDQVCPPDAPVVMTVQEEDIREATSGTDAPQ